jgi:adenine phosphoribosyltransferase
VTGDREAGVAAAAVPPVDLGSFIRDVPDFPKPGVVFKDITPLLADAGALEAAVGELARGAAGQHPQLVLGAEARGFPLGAALARELGAGFVPARKPGRLPRETISAGYALEYGTDTLEIHGDAIAPGTRVLVHDDLLATGGTALALCELVERAGAQVIGLSFLIELAFLGGRAALGDREVHALLRYDSE